MGLSLEVAVFGETAQIYAQEILVQESFTHSSFSPFVPAIQSDTCRENSTPDIIDIAT
jgi:hypothetical protein